MRPAIWPDLPAPPIHGSPALLLIPLAPGGGRAVARQTGREALDYLLQHWLGPGRHWREGARGPQVPGAPLTMSVSYAGAWAALAVGAACRVGLDLVHLSAQPTDPQELAGLLNTYLAPQAAAAVCRLAPPERAWAFACAWAELEARSKALGLPLAEWRPAREAALQTCPCTFPPAPAGYCLAVAWAPPLPPLAG